MVQESVKVRSETPLSRVLTYKFVLWWSIIWAVGVMALAPIVNYFTPFLNPSYANQWTPDIYWRLVLYWHGGIFIPWITALAVLTVMAFKFDTLKGLSAKLIKESIFFGGFVAVPIAGIAGLFDVYDHFALGAPLWLQIFAFLVGDEMAIALIVAMINYPRSSGRGYEKVGLPFYAVLLSVSTALIAALMGHVAGYMTWFGPQPPLVSQYISSTMGYYNSSSVVAFTENVVTSHSHLMLPSLMAGVVSLVAFYYGYEKWSRREKLVSGFGFFVMMYALVASAWIYIVSGVSNYATPTLLVFGAGGINGAAEDDVLTGLVGFGAFFVLIGLIFASRSKKTKEGGSLAKDSLFLSVITGWILIYLTIPLTGFSIEFNQTFFAAAGSAFDDAFSRFHQDFGFYLLPVLVTSVLIFEAFGISGKARRRVGLLYIVGEIMVFVFGELYSMVYLNTILMYTAIAGVALIFVGGLVGAQYLREKGVQTLPVMQTTGIGNLALEKEENRTNTATAS